ncbi:hypothetical protein P171DRAFT_236851 [Karstenula rhodostoma CBS 690.94]|uniref:Uncharacterized protein n=1 Tax=Karstenula rhodostoma CBS 690.94 TaxID=1392251 RepID=A0A9P4UDN9_9PLEO|nr:hypothetical protein P171DRAFT_236851 [Karstenula rhodostoma CBS 690.94]
MYGLFIPPPPPPSPFAKPTLPHASPPPTQPNTETYAIVHPHSASVTTLHPRRPQLYLRTHVLYMRIRHHRGVMLSPPAR